MKSDKDWSKATLIVFVGLVASIISIFIFITGKQSIPEILSTPTSLPNLPTSLPNIPTSLPVNNYPTETPLPTLATQLVFDDSQSDWLLSSDEIPNKMDYTENGLISNEEAAKKFDNPAEAFSNLNESGRVNGYYQRYVNDCSLKTGLREIATEVVFYKDPSGAQKGLDLPYLEGETQTISTIGESGYIVWMFQKSSCEPADDIRSVYIAFRRLNVIGFVYVSSIDGTMKDDDLLAIVTRLAKHLDLKLVANIN